jgi:pyruvate,water dikinase
VWCELLARHADCTGLGRYDANYEPLSHRDPEKMTPTSTTGIEVQTLIRWFSELGLDDVAIVGGKNASLGEMIQALSPLGVQVPMGFATTAAAYRQFLQESRVDEIIARELAGLDPSDVQQLRQCGRRIRHAILAAEFPAQLRDAILEAYRRLAPAPGVAADVAVRSSATAEDLPEASFAGQQETYLNVQGEAPLLDACRRCYASLFTDRAISYRAHHGFDHMQVALSIGVQRMVRSDLGAAGVMFSLDTETGFRDMVLINAAYGLGESVVQGIVNPDEYYVFKPTLREGCRPIVKRTLGSKESKLVYDIGGSKLTRYVPVPPADRQRFALSDDQILTLARWACIIEDHYTHRAGRPTPMDMEWALDGRSGELFILQARPETVQSQRSTQSLQVYRLQQTGRVLVSGRSVGQKIAAGPVRVIDSAEHLDRLRSGEVLVTDKTDPDWEPVMKRAAAIVTNRGGRTCHAAIVSRELGLPAIVGAEHATSILTTGQQVTVSCAQGETGYVYDGVLDFQVEAIRLDTLPRLRTKMMINLGNPDEALRLSALPCDGVGLARIEFIINSAIGIHPMALVRYPDLSDPHVVQEIARRTHLYDDKQHFFVDMLAQGVGLIAAAFYPRDVIVRFSDFKTNEYAHLLGGRQFEPREENPMIGFRGAARYTDPRYREAFALECAAMRRVRDEMGLTNVKLMIPFCRTVDEVQRVLDEMARHGLVRGERGLQVYLMCEIPSNVILADQFAALCDGFSIGSNDLTQLVLGVDRESELLRDTFRERDPAVMRFLSQAIAQVHAAGRPIGICGQAPSDDPQFAQFVVQQGIDSISLTPDSFLPTLLHIAKCEGAIAAT